MFREFLKHIFCTKKVAKNYSAELNNLIDLINKSKNDFANTNLEEWQSAISQIICYAYNNYDADILKYILHDDVEYSSVWVFESIKGKSNFLRYLSGKFITIKSNQAYLTADNLPGHNAIRIFQNGNIIFLIYKYKDGFITNLDLTPILF